MFWTTPKGRAAKPRTYVRGTGFAAEGICSEEGEKSDTELSHRENADYSERVISPLRAQKTQRKIRLKYFVIFVYFVVDKDYDMSLDLRFSRAGKPVTTQLIVKVRE